jgi:pimeloyl-ACP methyl ester carboxylesterase
VEQGGVAQLRTATVLPIRSRGRILRGVQPGARFAVVPGAGHWVQFEAADAFNRLIAEFATS